MPAKIPGIFSLVCKKAVTTPAMTPPKKAINKLINGLLKTSVLCNTKSADNDEPKTIEPSAVRSAKSNNRKEIKTPRASKDQISPDSKESFKM